MKTDDHAPRLAKVLIVDDFEDNRQMYAEFLTYSGYQVLEATDGAEAIAKAKELAPDLVVMDLSLPVMDGWEATRRLKGDPQTRHIPILALTGHSFDGHSRGAHDAGCDGFLAKPCLPERLLQAVRQMLSSPTSQRW
jgi:two-component system, cell cycle response regulator DivK